MSAADNEGLCSLSTCPLSDALLEYQPTLVGNGIYLGIFAALLFVHSFLGIRYRTWGFLVGSSCTFILEVIGYAGRLVLHGNPFPLNNFLLYFIPLALAPAFLTGAVYLTFGRYILATHRPTSRLAPRTYTITFISFDFTSLLLQAVGGALTSVATTDAGRTIGVDILIAGLTFQVFSTALFLALWSDYEWRLRRVPEEERNPAFANIRRGWRWRGFAPAVFGAMVFIFVRCVYRCVELQSGFGGSLANDQTTFMVLEAPMIIAASVLLAVWHPGVAFQGRWGDAAWKFNGKDGKDGEVEGEMKGEKVEGAEVRAREEGGVV